MKTNKINIIPSTFRPLLLAALAIGALGLLGSAQAANLARYYGFENASNLGQATVGPNATVNGTITQSAGPTTFGYAGNFTAGTEYLSVAASTAPESRMGVNPGALACWFKTTDTTTARSSLIFGTGSSSKNLALIDVLNPGGQINMLIRDGATSAVTLDSTYTGGPNLADGNWHHVAWTWSGKSTGTPPGNSIQRLYIDGSLVLSATNTSIGSVAPTTWYIGSRGGTSLPFNGYLDEVRIYAEGAVLTDAEVQAMLVLTTTTLTSSLNPSTLGDSVIFTATVLTNGVTATNATGTVIFKDGATALSTVALVAGVASYTNNALAAGIHNLTASYSGGNYLGSTSATLVQTVVPVALIATTLALTSSTNSAPVDTTIIFTATVLTNSVTASSASGTVVFKSGGTALSTNSLSGGAAQFTTRDLPLGTSYITAEYSGDVAYLPSTNSPALAQAVIYAPPILVRYYQFENAANLGQATVGPDATVTGTINPAAGPTGFGQAAALTNGGAYLLQNPASSAPDSTIGLNPGALACWFKTTNDYSATRMSLVSGYVNNAQVFLLELYNGQVDAFVRDAAKVGCEVLYTASLSDGNWHHLACTWSGAATGVPRGDSILRLYVDGTLVGSATNASVGSVLAPSWYIGERAGSTFPYSGCVDDVRVYAGGAVLSDAQVQGLLVPTTVTLASSANPVPVGNNVIFTATLKTNGVTAGNATGTVVFKDGGTPLSTIAVVNGVASYTNNTLAAGYHTITAAYSPGNYSHSFSPPLVQGIQPASLTATTVALATSLTPSTPNQSVTFTATVQTNSVNASDATGTVVFKNGGAPLSTNAVSAGVAGFSTSGLPLGTHYITAEYSGDILYTPATNTPALAQVVSANVIVQASLSVYFRADDADGAGNPGTALTTTLVNLAKPGTYDGTIVNGSGVTYNAGQAGTPYAYGVPLSSASLTRIEDNSYQIAGGVNKVTAASWEFWLRVDNGAEGSLYGEYASSAGGSTRHYFRTLGLSDTGNSYLLFDEFAPSGGSALSAGGYFQTGVFTQLVITKSGDTVRFYRNGTLFSTATNSETYSGSTVARTWFGVRPNTTAVGTDGQFNLIRVYDRVLSDADVGQNFYATAQHRPTSVALGSSVIVAAKGSTVTFTATVQTNGVAAGDAIGSMVFRVDGALLATNAVSGGVATFNTSALVALGSHTIQALYSGDTVYGANASPNLAQVVAALDVAVTTASYNNPSVQGDPVTFQAVVQTNGAPVTGTIGGTMTFKDGSSILESGIPVTSATTLSSAHTTLTPGWHYITAEFSGDANYGGGVSSLSYAQAVVSSTQTPTTMTLGSSANPSVAGNSITLIATLYTNGYVADGAAGTVVFKDGPVTLGSAAVGTGGAGVANFLTAPLVAGVHALTAEYSGDVTYGPSPAAWSQTVQAPTTLVVGSSANPSAVGVNVTLTATVQTNGATATAATGIVTFSDGESQFATTPTVVNGVASLTVGNLTLGSHYITAYYTGDSLSPQVYPAASSGILVQAVELGTTTALVSSLNPSTNGDLVTFTATVRTNGVAAGNATGTMTFRNGGSALGSPGVTNGVATFDTSALAVGTNNLTAEYSGDSTYVGSTSTPALAQVVKSSIATSPPIISCSVNSSTLTLSWPADHLGWILQGQTNTAGLGVTWADMPGTALVTSTNLAIVPANPSVFYRLRYPSP